MPWWIRLLVHLVQYPVSHLEEYKTRHFREGSKKPQGQQPWDDLPMGKISSSLPSPQAAGGLDMPCGLMAFITYSDLIPLFLFVIWIAVTPRGSQMVRSPDRRQCTNTGKMTVPA